MTGALASVVAGTLAVIAPAADADPAAASDATTRVSAGSSTSLTGADGRVWAPDAGFIGGSVYRAKPHVTVSGTADASLYQKYRQGMSGYRLPVSSAGTVKVTLHFAELQLGGRGKRVFDVSAEGRPVLSGVDVYREAGRAHALTKAFAVEITDGVLDLGFTASKGTPVVSGIEITASGIATSPASPAPSPPAPAPPTPTPPAPTPPAPPAPNPPAPVPPSQQGSFPTPGTTGPRVATSALDKTGSISSTHDGQIIDRKDVTGTVQIRHDNVTVRDSHVRFTATYGLNVRKKADGSCPVGTRFEYVEVDGTLADESHVPVYGAGCAWTLDHAHVHNVGRAIKLTSNNTVSNSYVVSSRTGDSGSHRGAVGNNGGRNNKVINNVLMCEGSGCSAAIPMYGDFAPVDGMLVQRNLIATTGSYCVYGGSLDHKKYPLGSNIKFIDNHFSSKYHPKCGRYGHLSGFDENERGNEWRGNVWHETGKPID